MKDNQTHYATKVDKEIVDDFRQACKDSGMKQCFLIEKWMRMFIEQTKREQSISR